MPSSKIQRLLAGRFIIFKLLFIRLYCLFHRRDKRIREYKNKHKGERCFLIATGPSLSLSDVEKLDGKVTFSLNSIVNLFDKTKWRPTYYMIADDNVYKKLKKSINELEDSTVFWGDFFIKHFERDGINIKMNLVTPMLMGAKSKIWRKELYKRKFSDRADKYIYYGFSTVYLILQLIAYMGFSEVVLLGADCNYENGKEYSEITKYDNINHPKDISNKLIWDYEVAKDYFDKNMIKVYNATRGGILELFERKELEELL